MPVAGIKQGALAWYDAGCSVWPPAQDGTKRPSGEWKRFQSERAPRTLIEQFYSGDSHDGIGIICGKVSGNLEMLELEGRATDSLSLDRIRFEVQAHGIERLWETLLNDGYAEWTPSGGIHFLYRVPVESLQVPGNTKIARRLATPEELAVKPDDKYKTLAETRGEGGYVIVAPSGGRVHPTGDTWSTFAGKIGQIPIITKAERDLLHQAIHDALDEIPEEPEFTGVRPVAPRSLPMDSTKPGDDFMMRTTWEEILEPHGWRVHHRTTSETFWTRPGKERSKGWSATTGLMGTGLDDRLYVWSSSTVFQTEKPYNKFSAYTLLEHGGDFAAAARDLGARGYGSQRSPMVASPFVPPQPVAESMVPVSVPQETGQPQNQAPIDPPPPVGPKRDPLGLPLYDSSEFDYMPCDGITVARKWVELYKETFSYVSADKAWMMWDGKRWASDSRLRHEHATVVMVEHMLIRAKEVERQDPEKGKDLVKEIRKLTYANNISSIIRNARSDPRVAVSHEDFDKDPNLVTVENGVLNLQTMQLGPHDPSAMMTKKIKASYDPHAPSGRWHQFMREVLPDKEVRDYVQRVCGYMLTGSMAERVMVLLYGESGTGKTQFLEALSEVMGDFAGVAPASAFQPRQSGYKGPSEDLHKLRGKRFVMQSELDAGSRLNEPLVKSIVGADTQSTRPLYGAPVDWKPEYTVFLATNHLPRISSSENAIWNRVKPINFAQVFIDDKGQALDPGERSLGRRMASQEASSILNWLLEGLAAYREMGLAEPEQIGLWLTQYREDVDTCRQFLTQAPEDGMVAIEPTASATVTEVYRKYLEWCQHNGITPLGMRNFNTRIESAGFVRKKSNRGISWIGIGVGTGQWIVGDQRPYGFKDFRHRE